MLGLLNISNFALVSDLRVEFERGLNLLTGETGSGKSIIVDALGVLIGGKFSTDLIRSGEEHASVEGLFHIGTHPQVAALLGGAGLDARDGEEGIELVVRRELSAGGRNKVFVNNRLSTLSLLRELRPYLVDIHGQGEQQTLFEVETHLELLDAFAGLAALRQEVAGLYRAWSGLRRELDELRRDESEKLNLLDGLRFQVGELEGASLVEGEDERLEEERRRLNNLEKVAALCADAYNRTYEENDSTVARLSQLGRQIAELSGYESSYRNYAEGLSSARALLEDLAHTLRGFADGLTFSPERLAEVESRLAELARLKRKYGGGIASALEHLARARERLAGLEHSDERAEEIAKELKAARDAYLERASRLHRERAKAAKDFRRGVERSLGEVAMDDARFEARVEAAASVAGDGSSSAGFTSTGIDRVEFFFSANAGEPVRPLSKVASGGEASRLMLVLKTIASPTRFPRTIVFDEVDAGIGGRVSEAVGLKLKALARTNQVLCVTHQAQIARFADTHLLVSKTAARGRTEVGVERLERARRVEEIARMLTGAEITDTARRHAREMLKTA
ncbi:MAG TPA: DNA repair protein RecN [Pyrinomonadaceae bacterium]|jgi:DNA repair protein RecN (Recombination protein N)|nr:DNA repair protein RecN [Pyrinomonadaceae bacterium]